MASVFNEIDTPGMFAAQTGRICPVLIRPNMSSTPSRVHDNGFDFDFEHAPHPNHNYKFFFSF
jgi:hypothetical protein